MEGRIKIIDKDGKIIKGDNFTFKEGDCFVITKNKDGRLERLFRAWKHFTTQILDNSKHPVLLLEHGDEIKIIRFVKEKK